MSGDVFPREPTGKDKESLSRNLNYQLIRLIEAQAGQAAKWGIDWTFLSKRKLRKAIERTKEARGL